MKNVIKKIVGVYGALGLALVAILIQQVATFYFAIRNIIPSGLAKHSVNMRGGKITLDGERTISLFELPVAGAGMLWGSLLGSMILLVGGYFTNGRSLSGFHFKTFSWRAMAPWVVAYLFFGGAMTALEHFFPVFRSEGMTTMIQASATSPILAIIGIGIAVPFFEELVFRGWLFNRFEMSFSPVVAVIATSVLFTAMHVQYNLYILSALLVLALILGMMRHKTGSIWPSIIIHCLNNTIATLVAFNQM